MPEIQCHHCGQMLSFPDSYQNAEIRCPRCQNQQTVRAGGGGAGPNSNPASPVSPVNPVAGTEDRSGLVFALGLLGLVMLPPLGPIAWYLGSGDLKRMQRGEISNGGYGLTQAGMVMGIVSTVMLLIGFAIFALWIVLVCSGLGLAATAGAIL